jgi:branched-chain amino acid transport system permease protein
VSLLRLDALDVLYGDFQALFAVDLDLPENGSLALVGANGAGKTTLLRTIAGAMRPARGTIEFAGSDITPTKPHLRVRRGIALVPEGRRLFPSLTAEENILVGAGANTRSLDGGGLAQAGVELAGGIVVSWLRVTGLIAALAVLGVLQVLLSSTSWGRSVRATSDDVDTARLVGVRVRPVFATVAGVAVATAALAGVFLGMISAFDPLAGSTLLIFAFEAVVIGGLGSLWGTLAGGIALGLTQQLVGEWNSQYAVLAVHLLFLLVLAVRPQGMFR